MSFSVDSLSSLQHVSFAYRTREPALRDVTMSVGRGETVALLGRNGAGKSTLLYLLMGLLRPHRGEVRTFGLDPVQQPVRIKQRIGFASELPMFPVTLSAADVLNVHRTVYPTWDRTFERELVEQFGLGAVLRKPNEMSKGQRQQLALLCAVCHRPDLLILDEPAAGLDPVARREFLATILRQLHREGSGIIFSSHHLADVERLGGRAVLLHGGHVALDAPLDDLRESHSLALVAQSPVPADRWAQIPGVFCRRAVQGTWRAVVRGSPAVVEAMLRERLGTDVVQCAPLTLEELFVECTSTSAGVASNPSARSMSGV